jgi:hypothetical protein
MQPTVLLLASMTPTAYLHPDIANHHHCVTSNKKQQPQIKTTHGLIQLTTCLPPNMSHTWQHTQSTLTHKVMM